MSGQISLVSVSEQCTAWQLTHGHCVGIATVYYWMQIESFWCTLAIYTSNRTGMEIHSVGRMVENFWVRIQTWSCKEEFDPKWHGKQLLIRNLLCVETITGQVGLQQTLFHRMYKTIYVWCIRTVFFGYAMIFLVIVRRNRTVYTLVVIGRGYK